MTHPTSRLVQLWRSSPTPALVFGLGGLIPFLGLTLLVGIGPLEQRYFFLTSLTQYGAIIVTFVGALQWGYGVRSDIRGGWSWVQYGWSILPGLAAWASLTLSVPTCLRVQAFVLVACFVFDRVLSKIAPIPEWFVALRAVLTVVAASMLLTASLLR